MKEIQLTQCKVAIVDDDDYEWLNQWKWYVNDTGYAQRNVKNSLGRKTILKMHRLILGLEYGNRLEADHINRNKLDNTRKNLRVATRTENSFNKIAHADSLTGIKGIYWNKEKSKWQAQIRINGKQTNLGRFCTKEIAHQVYCEAALKYHGEFANFGNGCVILDSKND